MMSNEKRFTKCCPKIRDNGEEMTCTEVEEMLNTLHEENQELKKEDYGLINKLEEDLDYYKAKSASCEEGLIRIEHDYHQYKQKVAQVLQKHYTENNEGNRVQDTIRVTVEVICDELGVDLV